MGFEAMPWAPGQSGNPGGNRANKPIRDAIFMELAAAEEGREDPVPKRSLRMAVRKQLEKACNGDLAALQFLAERMEGKPKQVIVGDGEEDPIALMVSRGEEARTRVLEQLSRIGSQVVSGIIEDTNASDEDKLSSARYW
jgi:Family of unknown function (DUF5681)